MDTLQEHIFSRVGEGALHEKLSPLCLVLASHGQQNAPTCCPCVATHLIGGAFRSLVYQSAGIPAVWLVCSRGSSESGQLLKLGVKGVHRSRKWPSTYRSWLALKCIPRLSFPQRR
ncbi:hypothetical protein AVEN_160684-1 [Araneus ventricosus]|uniref:Uncharacterized protein n=1 Tax=Araneus ventricosus TaxID=182803 RepID=A0A4Y2WYU7_ARAVE|nr:hypothetical protein AVEN_160684-1 [Araneus ventricosus]